MIGRGERLSRPSLAPKPPAPDPDYTTVLIICGAAIVIVVICAVAWGRRGSQPRQ